MRDATRPPVWAEALLLALLPADRAQSVSGDLLEAYRDEQLPTRGRAGANRWYVRQIGGRLVRTCAPWLALVVVVFAINRALAIGRVYTPLQAALAYLTELGIIVAAGVYSGWRTGRLLGGVPICAGVMLGYSLANAAWLVTRVGFSLSLVSALGPRALALALTAGLLGGAMGAAARAAIRTMSRRVPPLVGA